MEPATGDSVRRRAVDVGQPSRQGEADGARALGSPQVCDVRAMPCRARMDTTSSSLSPVRARAPRRPLATRSSSTARTSATATGGAGTATSCERQACDDWRHRRLASADVAAMRAIFHMSAASAAPSTGEDPSFPPDRILEIEDAAGTLVAWAT